MQSQIRKYIVDTNVFINAFNSSATEYADVQFLLQAYKEGRVGFYVSLHTLSELEKRKDEAWELAKTFPQSPHYPIGSWDEQVGTWDQACGTWDDARKNEVVQNNLCDQAKAGTSIQDRGAFVDGLCSDFDGFLTSDGQFVKSGPLARINANFELKVITPEALVAELAQG